MERSAKTGSSRPIAAGGPRRTLDKSPASLRVVLFLLLLLNLWYCPLLAQTEMPCEPSIQLAEQEYGYGPPDIPVKDVTREGYERAKNELANRGDFYSLFCLGYMGYELKEYAEAIHYFAEAEKLITDKVPDCPCCAHFYTYVGLANEEMGNLEVARDYYLRRGDPYYAHLVTAKIARRKGDLSEAELEYLLAQSVALYEMNNFMPFWEIAKMYFEVGQLDKAKFYVGRYLKCGHNPDGYTQISDQEEAEAEALLRKIDDLIKTKKS